MRIISGTFGKRLIKPPKNLPVRPTTDLAKESLFNIIANRHEINGTSVLDLFAGTGSLSYEFVSRGAKEVIAVEQNYNCIKFIKSTSASFKMNNLNVIKMDVFRFLDKSAKKFDFIFADPPYVLENIKEIKHKVFDNKLLTDNGLLIIEHPEDIKFEDEKYFLEHRKYSRVNFSFFSYNTDNQ